MFSSQVAGPLEANDHSTTHLNPPPLCSYLTRQNNTSVKRRGGVEMIFWDALQLCGAPSHHLSLLPASVFRADVRRGAPPPPPPPPSRASLRKALMDFQSCSKNNDGRPCGGTPDAHTCSEPSSSGGVTFNGSGVRSSAYCPCLPFHDLMKLLELGPPMYTDVGLEIFSDLMKNSISSPSVLPGSSALSLQPCARPYLFLPLSPLLSVCTK